MMLAPDELPVTANTCTGTCGKEEANALKQKKKCCLNTTESFMTDDDDDDNSTGNKFESTTDEAIPGVQEWFFKNFLKLFRGSRLLENVFSMHNIFTTGLKSNFCYSLQFLFNPFVPNAPFLYPLKTSVF